MSGMLDTVGQAQELYFSGFFNRVLEPVTRNQSAYLPQRCGAGAEEPKLNPSEPKRNYDLWLRLRSIYHT
jgi:hypothetical protein